ncbi:MAG: hypothetical protein ACI8XO_004323 [Verrucomicrobiales bacterium]|jgi:hypothetical protein
MKTLRAKYKVRLLITIASLLVTGHAHAWEPNAAERNAAIAAGDFKP